MKQFLLSENNYESAKTGKSFGVTELPTPGAWLTRELVDAAFHKFMGRKNNQTWIGYKGQFLDELFPHSTEEKG